MTRLKILSRLREINVRSPQVNRWSEVLARSHDSSNHKNSSADKKMVFVTVDDLIWFKTGRDVRIESSLHFIQSECRQNMSRNDSQNLHPSIDGNFLGFYYSHCGPLKSNPPKCDVTSPPSCKNWYMESRKDVNTEKCENFE